MMCYICSAANKDGQLSPRTGYFKLFREKEISVRKWNPQEELFSPEVTEHEELNRFTNNKKELDRFCGPYPYER